MRGAFAAHSGVAEPHAARVPSLALSAGRRFQLIIKHGLDWLFALVAVVLLAPLLLALTVAVRRSGGLVVVRERRLARAGREFDLFRFRCEPVGLSGPRSLDRPVLTRAGRFLRRSGLEDLPQLFNLLKGDLSLVGPRPLRPEVQKILGMDTKLRTAMRPGITGPAQLVALRGAPGREAGLAADHYYVREWSLWLDVRIVGRTIVAAFRRR